MRGGALVGSLMVLLLVGCGGSVRHRPPEDTALTLAMQSGAEAMSLQRPLDATADYDRAYTRALIRDDADAIGNAGTNLAIASLAAGDAAAAVREVERTRADLAARNAPAPFELDLAEAASQLRLGQPGRADRLAARAEQAPDAGVAARAAFLRGLAADVRGDTGLLARSFRRLDHRGKVGPTWEADESELASRLAVRSDRPRDAERLAQRASDLRRSALDYRGMVRDLRLGAEAAAATGDWRAASRLTRQADQSEASLEPA